LNDKSGSIANETTVKIPPSVSLFHFDFFEPLPIQIEVSDAPLTSDAGLLPLRQFDERIGLTKQFAAVLDDPRDPELTEHTFLEMVRSRVFGILAGYFDQNDPSF
jgi:Transposase DDE domain group 1